MNYRFQDKSLSHEERALDLLQNLTREEKIAMLTSQLDDVPRLGIKKTFFGTEIARGLVNRDQKRESTILPQPWGMAAMFDTELMEKLGDIAGDEVRIANQCSEDPASLVLFGPTVDMERDPRWGRNEEAYGEDPCLTTKLTIAYTKGLKGYDKKYIKTAPLLKHFYANNYENERQTTNAFITPRLKREYYLKAFEGPIVEGGAAGLMTAYNKINGLEALNNPEVTDICKKEWGMTFAISDGGDFGQNVAAHKTFENHAKSIADILGKGADMMLDSRKMVDPATVEALEKGYLTEENLDKAIYATLLLRFMLGDFDEDSNPYTKMDPTKLACKSNKELATKAGEKSVILLENKGILPIKQDEKSTVAVVGPLINENYVCWYCGFAQNQTPIVKGFKEYLGENRVFADEGFDHIKIHSVETGKYVRLDENNVLVADATLEDAEIFELGDWDYTSYTLRSVKTGKYVTEGGGFAGFMKNFGKPKVEFNPSMACISDEVFGWFVMEHIYITFENDIAYMKSWQKTDIAVNDKNELVSIYENGDLSCKKFKFTTVSKGTQRIAELAKKSDYVVVCGGNHPLINAREEYDRPDINLPKLQSALLSAASAANENTILYLATSYPYAINKEKDIAKAVVISSHIGPSLGHTAAKTIFGDINPAGRTPMTWYKSIKDLPSLDDYDIVKNHTTYLYFNGTPLYEFGYGLSYTSFMYSNLNLSVENDVITATIDVKNTGEFDGDEVVQLYVSLPSSILTRPIRQLKAFSRVSLKKGETKKVTLTFKKDELSIWFVDDNKFVVEEGEYKIEVGASSQDIRATDFIKVDGKKITGYNARLNRLAIEAEDYKGVSFETDRKDNSTYIEAKDFRSYAVYKSLIVAGADSFECILSSPAGDVDITLANNTTGEILGRVKSDGTGSLTQFTSTTCPITVSEDVIDLRVCFTKHTSLKSFKFFTK